jgi:peptide/nickel transport system permease protein
MAAQPPSTPPSSVSELGASQRTRGLRSRNLFIQTLGRVWRQRTGKFGISVVLLLVFTAIFAPVIAPHGSTEQFRTHFLAPPSAQFLLGTDQIGRDLLSRVIFATRASLVAGVLAVAFGAVLGVTTGMLAGYIGGWVDGVIMRIYDGLLAFPNILLAIVVITVLGPGLFNVAVAIGVAQTPLTARLTRSIVLTQRERDYVLAARSVGASGRRIIVAHLLPNTLPLLLVQFALAMGFAVLAEGGLSFLGLGTQPPTPSWGRMLNESRTFLREQPLFGIAPGVALTLLVLGLNFLADAMREALDPRRINIQR